MPLFRYHRGGLQESLNTTIVVKDKEDLKRAIKKAVTEIYYMENPDEFELDIFPYPSKDNNFDARIGWYTHMVTLEVKNIKAGPVGFLSEGFDE